MRVRLWRILCQITLPHLMTSCRDTFPDWTTTTDLRKFVFSCTLPNTIASNRPTSLTHRQTIMTCRAGLIVRVDFFGCSVESPRDRDYLDRDASSFSLKNSRHVRDQLETNVSRACPEEVSVVAFGLYCAYPEAVNNCNILDSDAKLLFQSLVLLVQTPE